MIDIDEHLIELRKIEPKVPEDIKKYFFNYEKYNPNAEFGFHDSIIKEISIEQKGEGLFNRISKVSLTILNKWKDKTETVHYLDVSSIDVRLGNVAGEKYVQGQVLWLYFSIVEESSLFKVRYELDGEQELVIYFKGISATLQSS